MRSDRMGKLERGVTARVSESPAALRERLRGLTDAELYEALKRDGGVMMSDERFGVYQMEYRRRKLKMPQ